MKSKKVSYFNIMLYIAYIVSIIYFLFKKDYTNAGLCTVAFIINLIILYAYYKNLIILDKSLYITASLFIFSCLVLGSSFKLYDIIKYYDDFLHFWSGFITVKIGFNIIKTIKSRKYINKLLIIMLLFFFSMGFASICEIIEYSLDTIFKMNTQAGGLSDTMQDMIDALTREMKKAASELDFERATELRDMLFELQSE